MKIQTKNISKSLNKTFLSQNPFKHEIDLFKDNYIDLLKSINQKDSEETLKDFINRFLNDTYYKNKYTIKENVNNIDLIIKTGDKKNDKIGVIIETKAIKNKPEMITIENINKKALHEIIVYYMEERFINNNIYIKHLIITNTSQWFIFDAQEFERIFYKNKLFFRDYKKWTNGELVSKNKDWFYSEIASKFIENNDDTINCTYFELPTLTKSVEYTEQKWIELYKIFSPTHLLKIALQNDSNTLNTGFYDELLHIIGLHEIKRQKVRKIERLPIEQQNKESLIENTINILQINEVLYNIKDSEKYGDTKNEQLFNIALELCIIWLNRILFLKLLEAQLLKYNNSDKNHEFLNVTKIEDFEQLSELFFEVLAVKPEEREKKLQEKYPNIPYLNSSLFEHSQAELETIKISQLKSHKELLISKNTVLKNKKGNKLTGTKPILNYIFEFLDSYNFASDQKAEIQETNKTIINSAVLGLIFEKINGYKEGSHFTPGFITMYMTRATIRKAVINKFNNNSDNDNNVETWTDLYNKIDKISIPEANKIVNSIKICDPSVGSGHFLVSALNEMISIKSDLKILTDETGRVLRDTEIEVINDELFITRDGTPFSYNYKNAESQRIQKTLFNEKQTIIENCLFGVDINHNSVNISRLRLWIELLKHTYYINPKIKNDRQLQTLPNIDINIKIGNSLISHFSLNGNSYETGKQQSLKTYTKKYKQVVADYKNANNREAKKTLERFINEQKENFSRTVNPNDEDLKELRKLESQMGEMPIFFSRDDQKEWQKKVKELQKKLDKLKKLYDEKLKTVYNQAFEWRFEFPEVLDENGNFIGFDVVIGNPPYIKEMNAKEIFMPIRKSGLWSNYIQGKMDLWYFFLHKAFDITSKNGLISYITNSYWVKSSGSKKLIQRIYQNKSLNEIINFNDLPIFDKVVGKHMIHSYEKNNDKQLIKYRNTNDILELQNIENLPVSELKFSETVKETFINIYSEQNIELTCEYKTLGELYNVSQGVVEAPDKINKTAGVFVISQDEYKQLNLTIDEKEVVKKYLNTSDIDKFKINWNKQYLLFTDKINRSKIANNDFPNLKKHLDKYTDNITSSNKPYGIHRDRSSKINPFEQKKLICKGMFKEPEFVYDENCYYVGFSFSVIWQLDKNYNLKYLLGLLNSSFAKHWFYTNGKKRGIGVDIGVRKFREFPVPKATRQEQHKIIKIVNKISKLTIQNKTIDKEIKQLDNEIFNLYKFSEDKITIIKEK